MTTLQMKKLLYPARESRKEYLARQFVAACNGDDIERESLDWYACLIELCGPFAVGTEISDWYAIEEARLLKLIG